ESRNDEQEDHQRRMDAEEAVVRLVVEELHAGLRELGTNHQREQSRGEEEEDRRRQVLDPDDLVVRVDAEVVAPRVRAVSRVVLGLRGRTDRVAHPVVEGTDPGEEADRKCHESADQRDDRAEPDRMPAAPPPQQADDPGADAEEEWRHPRRAQEPRVEQASPTSRRRLRAVRDVGLVVLGGDARERRHLDPFLAEVTRNRTSDVSCDFVSFCAKFCGIVFLGKCGPTYAFGETIDSRTNAGSALPARAASALSLSRSGPIVPWEPAAASVWHAMQP